MVPLESGMNVQLIFEEYSKPGYIKTIKLGTGSIQAIRTENVIQLDYKLPGETLPLYKIVAYSDLEEAFYYTFFEHHVQHGKEAMLNHSMEAHPDFFEWMIWNIL